MQELESTPPGLPPIFINPEKRVVLYALDGTPYIVGLMHTELKEHINFPWPVAFVGVDARTIRFKRLTEAEVKFREAAHHIPASYPEDFKVPSIPVIPPPDWHNLIGWARQVKENFKLWWRLTW